jgi:RNA polymerase sigma-70 factor (ECF subfamily)
MDPDRPRDDRIFHRYLKRPGRRRLARLVDAYYRFVWSAALRVTGNAADAADIAQDVFLKLLLHAPRPDQVRSPRGYLAWEVLGRAAALGRAAERRKARETAAAARGGEDSLPAADLDELRVRVRELPEELRTAVELRYFIGLRNGEIASLTGVGERQVEKRLERARDLLRSRLAPSAAAMALLGTASSEGSPPAATLDPPAGLRSDLLKIVRFGAALAPPAVKVAAAAAVVPARGGLKALVAAALLLLAGVTTAVSLPVWRISGDRADPASGGHRSHGGEPASGPGAVAGARNPEAGPPPPAEELPGAPYGSVRGTVWNEEGERIADARVTLQGNVTEEEVAKLREQGFPEAKAGPFEGEVLTGEDGEYCFTRIFPVQVTIDLEKPPYLPNFVFRTRIKAGEEKRCDPILCLPLRLRGSVRTPEGDPVIGAQIFIGFDYAKHYYDDPAEPGSSLEHAFAADDQGLFDTGFGIVNIRHFCSLPGYVLAPGREMKRFDVDCRDFKEREARLDLVLAPERRLAVVVRDPSGAPVAGAEVRSGELAIHRVLTDGGGHAALDRLPAEGSRIGISRDGFHEETVDLATMNSPEIEVILHPLGPGIEGRITFDDRLPPANREVSRVYFYELDDRNDPLRAIQEVRFDEETLTFSYRPKGPLRFEAICALGWRTLTRKPLLYDGRHPLRLEFPVILEPPFIAGRVVRAGSREPLAETPVTLRLPWRDRGTGPYWQENEILDDLAFPVLPPNSARTRTAADGSFLFLLSSTDRYRPGTPLLTHAILTAGSDEAGYSADLEFDLDVRAETVVEDVELEVEASGAIEGRVLDETGHPLGDAIVVAYDGYHLVRHAKSDAGGAYRIDGLRPGRYLLEFLSRAPYAKRGFGGVEIDAEGLPRPCEFFERPVRVEPGRTSRWDLDLRRDALGAIEGEVPAGLEGAARAGCALLAGGRPRGGFALGRETDVHGGRFRLERLRPGTYRVWLNQKSGSRIAEAEVQVKRGARASLVFPGPTG